MSFGAAYAGFKSGKRGSRSGGAYRDKSPEQMKKEGDEYYARLKQKYGTLVGIRR